MALSPAIRADLLELFATVRRDADALDFGNAAARHMVRDGQTLFFEGRSGELWHAIAEQLQNSAYIHGGPGAATIADLLDRACLDAVSLGGEAAITALEGKLDDLPQRCWSIGVPIRVPPRPVIIGSDVGWTDRAFNAR